MHYATIMVQTRDLDDGIWLLEWQIQRSKFWISNIKEIVSFCKTMRKNNAKSTLNNYLVSSPKILA